MILSVKTSFCKRLRGLINAANEGKGISQLPYWETLSDDDAATAADGDVAYDTAEEPTEEAEDKTSADAEDHHLQQSELRVSNNGVVVLQDDRAVSEPYQIPASSQISKAASSPATLDRYENSNPSGMSANTVSGEHGQKTQTRISPPKDSLETRSPKDDIISTELPPPEEGKDGDLIDYEDGDDPLIQTSTGSSTLAGDDPAPAATAEQEPNTDYNLELIPHTVAVTSTTATNVRPGTAEIFFGAEGLQGHGEDMSSKTHDLQQEYYHADGSENYGDSNGRVTFQLGSDDAGAELFKHIAHSPHSLDVEESLAGALDFDDETYGHESAGIPKIAKLDPRVIGDAHQDLLDQLPEDASDDHDESIHGVEIIHDYSEADGTGLSDHVGDNTATIEDLNAKAVTLGSTVDTDEINYEEDEPVDVASEQGRESTLGSKLLTTPRASSTKRLRGENAEVGALDDDSQDAKRVRSA
ncbi:hypothetical protein MMC16_000996 [Acarospora aff. strigata]|nr:hypothetical protein [Acarospora aff. strigata]